MEFKQVIVVRKDLKMRKGKLAAQVAHASMGVLLQHSELGLRPDEDDFDPPFIPAVFREWLNGLHTKVVVGCADRQELFSIYNKANDLGVYCYIVLDAGKTEFKEPTYTCVAIGPDDPETINELTGHLKLL